MKAEELELGDWVHSSFFGNTRITSLKELEGYGWIMTTGEENWKSDASLTPIPLTPEILEKNGFEIHSQLGYIYQSDFWFCVGGLFQEGFSVNINGKIVRMSYVHELQHALRLCGLNELADNFKV